MNPTVKKTLAPLLITLLLATSGLALAQLAAKPEALIKWRQSQFQVLAWNTNRIKSSLEGQYNKEEVATAANTISAVSKSGYQSLFAPGTEQGKGWHDTTAKPEVFKNAPHFEELAAAFQKEALELANVAAAGDPAAVKTQFGKLGRTCKACHDDFRVKD